MRSTIQRALPLALLITTCTAVPAFGHASVTPSAARPADLQVYTVTVPNEGRSPTTRVSLQVPEGIDSVMVETQAGWKVSLERPGGGAVRVVRWSGEIPVDGYARFRFIARNPVEVGEIRWPVVQAYADGSEVKWIGAPDDDEPASVTQISESARPVDVVSTHGEEVAAGAEPASPARAANVGSRDSGEAGDGDLRENATLGVAIAALLLAALSLVSGRRRRTGVT